MNRVVKSTAIAVASLGLAAALAGPAMAGPDPLGGLLGGVTGGGLLGGVTGGGGQNPLQAVTGLTQGKLPLAGVANSRGGAAPANAVPQSAQRADLSDAARLAGLAQGGAPLAALTGAPLAFAQANGKRLVSVDYERAPLPGVFGELTSQSEQVLFGPALSPMTQVVVPRAADRMSAAKTRGVEPGDVLSGPGEVVRSNLPADVSNQLASVLNGPLTRRQAARAAGGPLDGIAPLVEGPLSSVSGGDSPKVIRETVASAGQTLGSVSQASGSLTSMAPGL